jgi:hypothetical protein
VVISADPAILNPNVSVGVPDVLTGWCASPSGKLEWDGTMSGKGCLSSPAETTQP